MPRRKRSRRFLINGAPVASVVSGSVASVWVRHASSIAQELPLASDHESPHQRRCGVIVSRPFRRVGWKLCTQGRVSPPCHVGGKKSSCCHAPFTRLPARGSRPCGRHTIIGVDSGDGNERLRVIYISGWGRSGTTIVDRLLGQLPGFFSVGELRSLWDSDPSTQLCSCGHTIAECPVWAPSLSGAIGGSTGKEFAAIPRVPRSVWTEPRCARSMGLSLLHKTPDARTLEYGDRLEDLYRQVAAPIRRETVVDSSKHPSEAQLLSRRCGIEMSLLHMVRIHRSSRTPGRRQRHGSGTEAPPDRGALSSTAWWTAWNLIIESTLAPQLAERYRRARYEDVIREPRPELVDIARWAGGDPAALHFSENDEVLLEPGHLVAGNPNRSGTGRVKLVPTSSGRSNSHVPIGGSPR